MPASPSNPRRVAVAGDNAVFSNTFFRCTRCGSIKPAAAFGLRTMADGTVRNQAQCGPCRSIRK